MFANNSTRQKHGQIRLLEKQMRPEVIERCLQFVDVVIHQIIYQENLYHKVLFSQHRIYRSIVHHCDDKDLSSYISLCVASIRDFFVHQLVDMISVNICRDNNSPIILRRYLIEIHPIQDPCLRAVYYETNEIFAKLNDTFSQCLKSIQQIQPLSHQNEHYRTKWTFQFRIVSDEKSNQNRTIGEIFRQNPIYKQFLLINEQSKLLSYGKQTLMSSIKSFHCERLNLQFMCEDDHYEQKCFRKFNENKQSIHLDETDCEIDTDSDDDQAYFSSKKMTFKANVGTSISKKILRMNDFHQQGDLTRLAAKQPQINQTMPINPDILIDRYQLTQINRENIDNCRYLTDDDDRPESPCSPSISIQHDNEDDDQEEEL